MEKFFLENNLTHTVTESSNQVEYTLTNSVYLPATYIYYFNEQDRCIKEEIIYSCDSCLQQGFSQILNNKFTNWKQVSKDQYYAGFPYHTLLEKIYRKEQFILSMTWLKRKDLLPATEIKK